MNYSLNLVWPDLNSSVLSRCRLFIVFNVHTAVEDGAGVLQEERWQCRLPTRWHTELCWRRPPSAGHSCSTAGRPPRTSLLFFEAAVNQHSSTDDRSTTNCLPHQWCTHRPHPSQRISPPRNDSNEERLLLADSSPNERRRNIQRWSRSRVLQALTSFAAVAISIQVTSERNCRNQCSAVNEHITLDVGAHMRDLLMRVSKPTVGYVIFQTADKETHPHCLSFAFSYYWRTGVTCQKHRSQVWVWDQVKVFPSTG